jgi:hypothetical protein
MNPSAHPGQVTRIDQRTSPVRRRFLLVLTFFAAIILGLAAVEVIIRAFFRVTDVAYIFWDPAVGLRRLPNQTGRIISGNYIDISYHFNAEGWNFPADFQIPKPKGTRRICLVGDSQVEALQVNPPEAMNAVAEKIMNRPDRPVQWYPFGSTGLGTTQEVELIRHYVLDYHPDLVIIFFVQNDPFDSSPYIMPVDPAYPTYVLDGHDELLYVPATWWEPSKLRRFSSNFASARYFLIQKLLLQRIKELFGANPYKGKIDTGGQPLREFVGSIKHSAIPNLSQMSLESRQQKTWLLIEKSLFAAKRECERRGARLLLVYRGSPQEMDAPINPNNAVLPPRDQDPLCLGPRLSAMGPECLEPIAHRLEIPYLDLTQSVKAEVARTKRSHKFPDDGHYSALGHEIAGKEMAKWIEEIWVTQLLKKDAGAAIP